MRFCSSFAASGCVVCSCATFWLAACDYQMPQVDPAFLEDGGWGSGVSSSGNAGFGGATSSSSAESSSADSASATASSSSSSGTPAITCGNGLPEPGEQCDDSNTRDGDGCDSFCMRENHDGCGGAVLKLCKETVVIKASTAGAMDDITRSGTVQNCSADYRAGADLIYTVVPLVAGTLTAELRAQYNNHFMHIRNVCPGADANEIACDWSSSSSEPDVSTLTVYPGMLLYIIADGHLNDAGSFTLTLTLQ